MDPLTPNTWENLALVAVRWQWAAKMIAWQLFSLASNRSIKLAAMDVLSKGKWWHYPCQPIYVQTQPPQLCQLRQLHRNCATDVVSVELQVCQLCQLPNAAGDCSTDVIIVQGKVC
jgi:hypothetical protein